MPRWNITKGKIKKIKRKRNQSEKKNSIRKYKKHSSYKNNRRNKKNKTAKNYNKQRGGDIQNINIDAEIPIKQYMELVDSIPKFLRNVMGIQTQTEIDLEKSKQRYKKIGEKIKEIKESKKKINLENLGNILDVRKHKDDNKKQYLNNSDTTEYTGKKEKKLLDAKFWTIKPKDGKLKQEPAHIYSTIEFADDDELLELMGSVDRIQFLRSE